MKNFSLGAEKVLDDTCGAPGKPARSCSGYITLNARMICLDATTCSNAGLKGALAHEFFHVLQDAHNAAAGAREVLRRGNEVVWETSWYLDASAEWAAWYYAKDPAAYAFFVNDFQPNNRSLLEFGHNHEYGSWVWPLLMQQDAGPSAIFTSWSDAEAATDPEEIDDAVDRNHRFLNHFRDLSVRNLNPSEYFADTGVGLEADHWQTNISDFPQKPHVHVPKVVIGTGDQKMFIEVAPLAAQYDEFDVQDAVQQIEIDVASLEHAGNADIDVVGRLVPDGAGGPRTWTRVRGSGTSLTLCRDKPSENFDLIYVVLSNHGRARILTGGPDPTEALKGQYTITGKTEACALDGLQGTINWTYSFESDIPEIGVVNTTSATEQGTMHLSLVRDPAFPMTFEHIDDGTSSFSVDYARTDVYEDGSCNSVSTASGPANGVFSSYRDPFGRASFLEAQVAAPRPVFDQDTDFIGLIPFIPFQVSEHTVYSGTNCSGTSDNTGMGNAVYNMPGSLGVCHPPGMEGIFAGKLLGDWNDTQKQFEFGCVASLTTDEYVATLIVAGTLHPA